MKNHSEDRTRAEIVSGADRNSVRLGVPGRLIQRMTWGILAFTVLSGDDAVTIPLAALGGQGVISVVSNEIPGPMTQLAHACLKGDFEAARRGFDRAAAGGKNRPKKIFAGRKLRHRHHAREDDA